MNTKSNPYISQWEWLALQRQSDATVVFMVIMDETYQLIDSATRLHWLGNCVRSHLYKHARPGLGLRSPLVVPSMLEGWSLGYRFSGVYENCFKLLRYLYTLIISNDIIVEPKTKMLSWGTLMIWFVSQTRLYCSRLHQVMLFFS